MMVKPIRLALVVALCSMPGCGWMGGAVTRSISNGAELGPEWKVFTLTPPLEVSQVGQSVEVTIEGVRDWTEPHGALLLGDGSPVQVDVELRDQQGEWHRLVARTLGRSVGFGPETAEAGAGFAAHRRFVELRMRSSKTVRAKSIEWYCWTDK